MKTALITGYGQIGRQIALDLAEAGVEVLVMTRTGRPSALNPSPTSSDSPPVSAPFSAPEITHIRGDATVKEDVASAARGVDAIFACTHTSYDSRVWSKVLPQMDRTVLEVASENSVPVVFPESVYAFAQLGTPVTADSPFAPADDKGRIRQALLEQRSAHPAVAASVIAGDLIGRTAAPDSSVVRLCLTERIQNGKRGVVPARTDLPHGITVIADLSKSMIHAAELLTNAPAGTHRRFIAPSANPSLADIAAETHSQTGTPYRTPISIPHFVVRLSGLADRSMYELAELATIWRHPNEITNGEMAEELGRTDWREGVSAMLVG